MSRVASNRASTKPRMAAKAFPLMSSPTKSSCSTVVNAPRATSARAEANLKPLPPLALLPFTAEHIRVTGVLVREPGAPPFRGARPRPPDFDGTPEAPAPEVTADGQAAPPSPASTEAVAESSPNAEGALETPANEP